MSAGIDYGNGRTNLDPANGIRYGVIPQHEVWQAWADRCERAPAVYPDPEPTSCKECGGTGEVESDDMDGCEPLGFALEDAEYSAYCGECGDIFITRSPYYTYARYCSPCAPGAVYLMQPEEGAPRGYCFGHDWFEGGRAPYPVYRVDTGEEVAALNR